MKNTQKSTKETIQYEEVATLNFLFNFHTRQKSVSDGTEHPAHLESEKKKKKERKRKMTLGLINANPVVHAKKERIARAEDPNADDDAVDPLDVYDILFFFFLD